MAELHGFAAELPDVDSGDLRMDLLAVMGRHPPDEYADVRARILPHFMAYAARNPDFGKAWRTIVLEPPRTQLTRALRRAIRRGELPAALNLDFAIGLLQGPPPVLVHPEADDPAGPDRLRPGAARRHVPPVAGLRESRDTDGRCRPAAAAETVRGTDA